MPKLRAARPPASPTAASRRGLTADQDRTVLAAIGQRPSDISAITKAGSGDSGGLYLLWLGIQAIRVPDQAEEARYKTMTAPPPGRVSAMPSLP